MSKRRPYIGPSDAQSNAEALARRSAPYTAAADASVRIAWDWRNREPRDLREATRMVRKAYQDEVPTKLHDGPDAIGPDGTPRFSSRAEGYIFGDSFGSDARPGDDELVSYYHTPFRAALCRLQHGSETERRRGRIVSHVTIGSMGPVEAAITEKAHPFDAKLVAEDALRSFLHSMSDMKLHLPPVAETVTAAQDAGDSTLGQPDGAESPRWFTVPGIMKRACLDCRAVIGAGRTRCAPCQRKRDRARGSTVTRGYGSQHQAARARLKATLPGYCGYGCGAWLTPHGRWVAAHVVDGQPEHGYIASCYPCNERAKLRAGGTPAT